jgi:carbon monoxide dehydrogenase subunit G
MAKTTIVRTIHAPVERVFDTISNIHNFSKAVPHIVDAEILSVVKSGVGTRFRETRRTNGKDASTVLEVTEFVENERVRMVTDVGGTVWDTVFTVKAAGDATELTMSMDANAYKLLPKMINPLIKRVVAKAIEKDMDCVKSYCED